MRTPPPLLIGGLFRCPEQRGPCCIVLDRFRLFFSLFFIVSCRLPFFSRLQCLMLYFCRFSPCKSPVFLWAKILARFSRVPVFSGAPNLT
jgi:hypothetical protein